MAKIIRRCWTSEAPLGKRVRHIAFGYTNGKRERKFSAAWGQAEALKALSERQQQVKEGQIELRKDATLAEVAERYLQ